MVRRGESRRAIQGRTFQASPFVQRRSARPTSGFISPPRGRTFGNKRWHPRHASYRRWHYRPYYGYVIGGITLGTILAASAYYAYADEPPVDGLCWYWIDSSETRGYWDYCNLPYGDSY